MKDRTEQESRHDNRPLQVSLPQSDETDAPVFRVAAKTARDEEPKADARGTAELEGSE
jgi:hypothetical protein